MKKIMESLKRIRKVTSDKRYQKTWESLSTNEKLEVMLQTINRVNKEVA